MKSAKKYIRNALQSIYPPNEAESLCGLILEYVTGLNRLQTHLQNDSILPDTKINQIKEIVIRLLNHEPIQYIFKSSEFFGLNFFLSPAVLIPRPETEELVQWILEEESATIGSLLDIGTGSGALVITISKNKNVLHAEGWDVSEEALSVARKNALEIGLEIIFVKEDILQWRSIDSRQKWNIIVSNPPYVTVSEKNLMSPNVTNYEPHLALFVHDSDPLLFYREITDFAIQYLEHEGKLYFEINEKYGDDIIHLLSDKGFINIELRKDLQGKERMIRAERKSGRI